MAMAIKVSNAVEISDSDRDDTGRSTNSGNYVLMKKLPEVVKATRSQKSAHRTSSRAENLASEVADDVFKTHEILKKLLAKSASDDVTSLFGGADVVSQQASENVCIKTEMGISTDMKCKQVNTNKSCGRNSGVSVRLETHKQVEQRRRHEVSKNLKKLQSLLYPEERNRGKLPQLCILGTAISKVKSLKQANKTLLTKLKELSAYHKELRSRLAELGHPVDPLPVTKSATDEEVPPSINDNMKDLNTESIANNPSSNCCSTSPSQSCYDSFLDTDSSFQSDNVKQDSEIASNISELTSTSDKVDCDDTEMRSTPDRTGRDHTSDSHPKSPNPSQPQPATDSVSTMKSGPALNQETSSTKGSCTNHSPVSPVTQHSPDKPRPDRSSSSPSGSREKSTEKEFPSLLGRMFKDVENSLQRRSQEASSSATNKVTVSENSKKPVSLTCMPESNLVLTKCDRCDERVAFSSKVAGLVICPACSNVIIHFTPNLLRPGEAKKDSPAPAKPSLTTKRKKLSIPDVVIDLDSDSDHEANHQVPAPSRVTPSDVLDILKDGVRGYVDNVDGDEVIVVLK